MGSLTRRIIYAITLIIVGFNVIRSSKPNLFIASATAASQNCSANQASDKMKSIIDPVVLGSCLRTELAQRLNNLKEAHKLKQRPLGQNFITDILQKYIPSGTPVNKAHEVLEAAGFAIRVEINPKFLPSGTYTFADSPKTGAGFFESLAANKVLFTLRFQHSSAEINTVINPYGEILVEQNW